MAYSKYNDEWENLPSEATPILAEALDHIEDGIVDAASTADDAASAASSAASAASSAASAASSAQSTADSAASAADAAASAASSAQSTADGVASDLGDLGIGGVSGLESRLAAIEGRLDDLEA